MIKCHLDEFIINNNILIRMHKWPSYWENDFVHVIFVFRIILLIEVYRWSVFLAVFIFLILKDKQFFISLPEIRFQHEKLSCQNIFYVRKKNIKFCSLFMNMNIIFWFLYERKLHRNESLVIRLSGNIYSSPIILPKLTYR